MNNSGVLTNLISQFAQFGDVLQFIWFAIFPLIFYWIFKIVWMDYAQGGFFGRTKYGMMELIPPGDIESSPQPMELVLASIQGTFSGSSVYDEFCSGKITMPFSFEIMGTAGQVRLFVWFPENFRGVLESHFYAQYPGIELVDVDEDYAQTVPGVIPNKDWDLWGSDFELVADDAVPIKTWKYFEEDITGKMIDPMAGLIEVLGNMRPQEHLWMQLIVTPQAESWYNTGKLYADELKGRPAPKPKTFWQKMTGWMTPWFDALFAREAASSDNGGDDNLDTKLSPVERRVLEAVEENIGRYVFQTKMRMVYTGEKSVFDKTNVSGFVGAIKQFADFNLNSIKPNNDTKTYANFIFRKVRLRFRQHQILSRYRDRSMTGKKFFLSDRELATLYHIPDMSVVTPAMTRTGATQATAPANLPV